MLPFFDGGGLQLESVSFSAVLILLSITTFLGNSLILVALHKESSPHSLSKLLYRCLAITDLLVGLISQPLATSHWMLMVHEHWSLCRYVNGAVYITGLALSGVSLMTTAAISVDRLLALLLGLRYQQIVTLKRTYFIVAAFWVFDLVASLRIIFDHRITLLYGYIIIPLCLVVSLASYQKNFSYSRYHQARSRSLSTTAEPTKCTENGPTQKGSMQCTVGAVGISCL